MHAENRSFFLFFLLWSKNEFLPPPCLTEATGRWEGHFSGLKSYFFAQIVPVTFWKLSDCNTFFPFRDRSVISQGLLKKILRTCRGSPTFATVGLPASHNLGARGKFSCFQSCFINRTTVENASSVLHCWHRSFSKAAACLGYPWRRIEMNGAGQPSTAQGWQMQSIRHFLFSGVTPVTLKSCVNAVLD